MEKDIQPIIEEEFYAMIAPDGHIQTATIGSSEAECMAIVKLFHKCGVGMSWHELKMKGFTYQKVKVTIVPADVKK